MLSLVFEPMAAGWHARTDPLSNVGRPNYTDTLLNIFHQIGPLLVDLSIIDSSFNISFCRKPLPLPLPLSLSLSASTSSFTKLLDRNFSSKKGERKNAIFKKFVAAHSPFRACPRETQVSL